MLTLTYGLKLPETGDFGSTFFPGLEDNITRLDAHDHDGVDSAQLTNSAIATGAAIARSKLASGTVSHVLINDGSGVMSSEATLAVSRGGLNIASYTTGDTLYASGATTISKLGIGSVRTFLRSTGTIPEWGSSQVCARAAKTTTYTITSADDVITGDASGGDFTMTLPAASSNTGKVYFIKSINTGKVTIARAGSDTIDGLTSVILASKYDELIICSDGSATWTVLHWGITVAAKYNSNAGQAIEAAGSGEVIAYEDLVYDTHGTYNGTTGVATIIYPGRYRISAAMMAEDQTWTAGDRLELMVRKGGSAVASNLLEQQATNTELKMVTIVDEVTVAAGDTIDIFVDHNRTGGNFSLQTTAVYNYVTISRIGN